MSSDLTSAVNPAGLDLCRATDMGVGITTEPTTPYHENGRDSTDLQFYAFVTLHPTSRSKILPPGSHISQVPNPASGSTPKSGTTEQRAHPRIGVRSTGPESGELGWRTLNPDFDCWEVPSWDAVRRPEYKWEG